MSEYFKTDPIIVGGVGGSGTRIIGEVLKQMGVFIGSDLKEANGVQKICDFLNLKDVNISEISKVVKIQPTSGRYKNNDLSVFDDKDFDKIRKFGVEIDV